VDPLTEDADVQRAARQANLVRLLHPATLAVVGANEQLGMSNNAVLPMLEAGWSVHLINPKRDQLYGQRALPTLLEVGGPVDAVLSLVNAERAVEVVEQAGQLGCGGVVVAAAGFGESGGDGVALQRRLLNAAASGDLAIVGPNCSGFKNVGLGVNLFTGGRLDVASGGVSVVSQSGFLVRSALAAAGQRQLGVSIAVSSGNEVVCDLADHVEVLVDDEATTVICLVVETVRRPEAFLHAVARARAAGKPVLALKLGRSDRARRIMASHTGAIADEAWVYDLAFREYGIIGARDIDDLLDRAQLLAQLPPARRSPVGRIGIITTSGGVAALATDMAEAEGVALPALDELGAWVRERVPGDTVNPLDLTGFVMSQPDVMRELFARYGESVDALVLAWWLGDGDEGWSTTLLEPFAAAAADAAVPFVVSPAEATAIGSWAPAWRDRGLVVTRGLQSTFRAAQAVNAFLAPVRTQAGAAGAPAAGGARPDLIEGEAGPMLRFADAMALLCGAGVPVAPYVVLSDGDVDHPALTGLGDHLVVKLADVAHRTELGAVVVGVGPGEVAGVVARLRAVAAEAGVPPTVAVQPAVAGIGEAFAGAHGRSAFGPVVLFGLGGVLVETAGRIAGRFAPLDPDGAASLVAEVAGPVGALRGQEPWPEEVLTAVILGLSRLAVEQGSWLRSVDVNPLIVTGEGVVAVDALFLGHPSTR
jgi:acyl-CoA synthetase (NDP forming)